MYVIKVKDKDLFYNNRNHHGFHDSIEKADIYNTRKGASIALNTLSYWWNEGLKHKMFRKEYHNYIIDFSVDVEIREVKITLI